MPKVSVVIPSYQHAKFIGKAIQSVLDQSFQNFEIVITDDGSTDSTVDEILNFRDQRIKLQRFIENQGAVYAMNNAIGRAQGEFIAVLNSDDFWYPNKLKLQVDYLERNENQAAIFSYPEIVNENDELIIDHPWQKLFLRYYSDRYSWLRHFFYFGNSLCHPSVLIRRHVYNVIGLYDPRFTQLPDFDMWIRLASQFDFDILPEKLVAFRVLNNELNASAPTPDVAVRGVWEFGQILDHYMDIGDATFIKTFRNEIENHNLKDLPRKVVLGWLALEGSQPCHHAYGLKLLFDACGSKIPGIDTKKLKELITSYDPYSVRLLLQIRDLQSS